VSSSVHLFPTSSHPLISPCSSFFHLILRSSCSSFLALSFFSPFPPFFFSLLLLGHTVNEVVSLVGSLWVLTVSSLHSSLLSRREVDCRCSPFLPGQASCPTPCLYSFLCSFSIFASAHQKAFFCPPVWLLFFFYFGTLALFVKAKCVVSRLCLSATSPSPRCSLSNCAALSIPLLV